MTALRSSDVDEAYFNDLTQQPPGLNIAGPGDQGGTDERLAEAPRAKRIACVICRKRKLRCDGVKPSCGSCSRLAHDCAYDEVRKKSGPKRGYVKLLEARLAQVESLLSKTQEESADAPNGNTAAQDVTTFDDDVNYLDSALGQTEQQFPDQREVHYIPDLRSFGAVPKVAHDGGLQLPIAETPSWDMIALGLDEPLPAQNIIDDLNNIFFERVYPTMAMIHRPRYYMAMSLAPHMRPATCLRYAMWASAALVTDGYRTLAEPFYIRARKYLERDEMKGRGEGMALLAHCQTWALVATYEYKNMLFPRAWLSVGRACRLTSMLSLNRLDGAGPEVRQCLPPARDETELEERRRTFWVCFGADRFASVGTGWPMSIDEADITTKLPGDEASFEAGVPAESITLAAAFDSGGSTRLSSGAAVLVLTCLFGRNMNHIFRPGSNDKDKNPNGDFWTRHTNMDNLLSTMTLMLPDQLRIPAGLNDPNVIFLNLGLHTAAICIHQANISREERSKSSSRMASGSRARCLTAATEVANIMRQICHLDFSNMNGFVPFFLFTAARVFVHHLKTKPNDVQPRGSLKFLISALQVFKRKNPLAETFLVHIEFELMGSGLEDLRMYRDNEAGETALSLAQAIHRSSTEVYLPGHETDPCGPIPFPVPSTSNDKGAEETPGSHQSNQIRSGLPSRQRSLDSSGMYPTPDGIVQEMDTSPDGSGGDQRTPPFGSGSKVHTVSSSSVSPNSQEPAIMMQGHHSFPGQNVAMDQNVVTNESLLAAYQAMPVAATAYEPQRSLPTWKNTSTGLTPREIDGFAFANAEALNGISDAEWSHMLNTFGSEHVDQPA